MRLLKLHLDDFEEAYEGLIPFFYDVDDFELFDHLVNDFNGLLALIHDESRRRELDLTDISNVTTYLVKNAPMVLKAREINGIKKNSLDALHSFFLCMIGNVDWVNYNFRLKRVRRQRDGTYMLDLESIKVREMPRSVTKYVLEEAETLLNRCRALTGSRRQRRASR